MTPLGNRLQDRSANNLDFLRFLAAGMVIFYHCFVLLGRGSDLSGRWSGWQQFGPLGLRIFFFMSGMLVTGSWCHTPSVLAFLRKRALRIYPGLVAAIFFCTFVVGPLGTVFSLRGYLSFGDTYRYLLNGLLPSVAYVLPGVFRFNPCVAVNGSLWTLPYELRCYLVVLICGRLRLLTPRLFPFTGTVLLALVLAWRLLLSKAVLAAGHYRLGIDELCQVEFLLGMAAYIYRDRLPINGWLAWLALGAYLATLPFVYLGQYVALLAIPYLVLYIAQVRVAGLDRWARHGDLSYGLYIYAFPVQQLFIHTFDVDIGVTGLFALSTALTAGLAYFSWHWVERPAIMPRWNWPRWKPGPAVTGMPTAA